MVYLDSLKFGANIPSLQGSGRSAEQYAIDMDRHLEAQIYHLALDRDGFDYLLTGLTPTGSTKQMDKMGPLRPGSTPWMDIAKGELGTAEIQGAGDNQRIGEYLRTTGHAPEDEIAWCSAFVNWCMIEAGIAPTKSALARSWLNWGTPCEPQYGAVVILRRGQNPRSGHVAFLVESTGNTVSLLGGNQSDRVKISHYPGGDVLGYRWPN